MPRFLQIKLDLVVEADADFEALPEGIDQVHFGDAIIEVPAFAEVMGRAGFASWRVAPPGTGYFFRVFDPKPKAAGRPKGSPERAIKGPKRRAG